MSERKPDRQILYVHGHALKPSEPVLKDLCLQAVRSGIERDFPDDVDLFDEVGIDLVYYGDLIRDVLLQDGQTYDEELDVGDRRNALLALQQIPQRKKFGFRQYDKLPGKSAFKEFVADVIAPALGAVGLTLALVDRVAPDLARYLRNEDNFASDIRQRVRRSVTTAMDAGTRLMILSHGLGSVAVYDVLWQLSRVEDYSAYRDVKVDCLVTMGAPLSDDFLRKFLLGASSDGLERYPGNIISWMNVSAEDDFVCHDATIADDLAAMMRGRIVSRIRDFRIYNQAMRYGRSNPHSSVGYLVHPCIAKIVRDWLVQPV